jgi:hypothetical protein
MILGTHSALTGSAIIGQQLESEYAVAQHVDKVSLGTDQSACQIHPWRLLTPLTITQVETAGESLQKDGIYESD